MTASYQVLTLGAVAYAPKVVTIWEGFKSYFTERGLYFDYVLYSNYETLTEALLRGDVQLAWNSPLAFVRAERMARAAGQRVESIAMRDTDLDVQSLLVVPADSPIQTLADLRGQTVGFGAIDSPQATLIPLDHLRQAGLVAGRDYTARRFDVLGGKHGDHIGGERLAVGPLHTVTRDDLRLRVVGVPRDRLGEPRRRQRSDGDQNQTLPPALLLPRGLPG